MQLNEVSCLRATHTHPQLTLYLTTLLAVDGKLYMCIYSTLVDFQHAFGEGLTEESSKSFIHYVSSYTMGTSLYRI